MNAKLTPEQAIENLKWIRIQCDSLLKKEIDRIIKHIESQTKYAKIGEAFVAHQKAVPCDFGYNDEDCRCGDCCDTIRRLCELSAEVD